jgi:hypothetical protein
MVSEDSDQLVSGLPPVHRLSNTNNLEKSRRREVASTFHELHTRGEFLEVRLLSRPQRMLAKERNDPFHQCRSTGNDVLAQVLLVVVMTPIDDQASTPEKLLESLECRDARRALRYDKPWSGLYSGLVACATRAAWLPHESD